MTSDNTPITAALAQLAAHREQLTQLDTRETGHHTAVTERLAEITGLLTAIRRLVDDHQAALARLEGVDWKVTDVAAQLASAAPASTSPSRYQPDPAPTWWKLAPLNARNRSNGSGPGSSRSTGPATATWPPPSDPAGNPTTCACTGSTSSATCGPPFISSPAVPPGC